MVSYKEAIKRPFSNFKKFIIGVLVGIVPIFSISFYGYLLECARSVNKKDFKLPEWKNFGQLFVHGFLSLVITLTYLIPAFILLMIAISNYFQSQNIADYNTVAITEVITNMNVTGPMFIFTVLLGLLASYVAPIAFLKYSENYKFKEAFQLRLIFKNSFKFNYFIPWLLMVIYVAIISVAFTYLTIPESTTALTLISLLISIYNSFINSLSSIISTIPFITAIAESQTKH